MTRRASQEGITRPAFAEWLRAQIAAREETQTSVARGIGVADNALWHLLRGARPRYDTIGRIAAHFETDPAVVLSLVVAENEMSSIGRVMAPAMARVSLNNSKLAAAAGISAASVKRLLWVSRPANKPTLRRVAAALAIDLAELVRAQREIKEQVPARALAGVIKKTLHREGREGLRRRSQRLGRQLQKLTKEQREARVVGLRARFASATAEDQARWGRMQILPRPKAVFGLCRVCGKLCMAPRALTPSSKLEVHKVCFRQWRASGEYAAALPAYPRGRRLSPDELAAYYEAAVLYMRVKEHTPSGQRRGVPASVQDLAMKLELASDPEAAERRLRERVRRFLDLLPDLSVCSHDLAPKVTALMSLRRYLPATEK